MIAALIAAAGLMGGIIVQPAGSADAGKPAAPAVQPQPAPASAKPAPKDGATVVKQLIAEGEALDTARAAAEAERERKAELEKTTRAYETLRASLRTPAEVALEEARSQVALLNDLLYVNYALAKIAALVLAFAWNFLSRKYLLFKSSV